MIFQLTTNQIPAIHIATRVARNEQSEYRILNKRLYTLNCNARVILSSHMDAKWEL